MLSNLGYGGSNSYASKLYGVSDKAENPMEQAMEAEEALIAQDEDEDPCVGKRCTANEHCCDGHVCVDTEDEVNEACKYIINWSNDRDKVN